MARVKTGPYGEPVFPKAEEDLTMDGFIRYKTTEPFDDIARFYEKQYADTRFIQTVRSEEKGWPVFCAGVGARAKDIQWAAIVVMIDRRSIKKRKQVWHILVTAR